MIDEITKLAASKNIGVIDAVVLFSEKNEIDIELLAQLVKRDSGLKARIQVEAEDLNILKKTARLPV